MAKEGSLKAKAFKLFEKGKDSSSPEVKALGLKGATRYVYYDNWKKFKAAGGEATKEKVKVVLPGGATIGPYRPEVIESNIVPSETEQEIKVQETNGEATKTEPESGEPKIPINLGGDHDRPSILGEVVGTGIPVTVVLSLKSLSFWEIAHSIALNLTLDNFIDDCIEDFFQGRGKDLGLVEIGDAKLKEMEDRTGG